MSCHFVCLVADFHRAGAASLSRSGLHLLGVGTHTRSVISIKKQYPGTFHPLYDGAIDVVKKKSWSTQDLS